LPLHYWLSCLSDRSCALFDGPGIPLLCRNLFSLFGGVLINTWIVEITFASKALFRNPITAGAFGAHVRYAICGLFVCIGEVLDHFCRVGGFITYRGPKKKKRITQQKKNKKKKSARSSGPFLGLALVLLALACGFARHT